MNWLREHKKIIIVAVVVLILVAAPVAVGAWLLAKNSAELSSQQDQSQGGLKDDETTLYSRAEAVAQAEGIVAAQKLLDAELDKTSNKTEKADIYGSKASIASREGDAQGYQDGLDFAEQGYELDPTYDRAALVAFYYEQIGDSENAIKYYQIAIDEMGDYEALNDMDKSSYDYYQSAIQDLKNA